MKAVQCLVCAFFFIFVFDITGGRDFTDIWSNLPTDFGNVVNDAWKGVLKAIKSPVKARRLGRNKRKKTTTTTTESLEILPTSCHFQTDVPRRPTIPIITQPEWKSLLDWRILHKPNLVKLAQEFHNRGAPSIYGREISSYERTTLKLTTYNEDNHFDHYTILKEEKEGQRKKINIPVLPTPKYKYEYLWRSKYISHYPKVSYSTIKPASRIISADETFTHFHSTKLVTKTEETGSLLKELKFGKYRLKIYYKLSFD